MNDLVAKLPYAEQADMHGDLVKDGWSPEEAHWMIQAAEFILTQKAGSAET